MSTPKKPQPTYRTQPTYHAPLPVDVEVDREFYVHDIISAEDTIAHWDAAVEAGKSLLWDALSGAIEKIALDVMEGYVENLMRTEKMVLAALDDQFNVLKSGREAVIAEAEKAQAEVKSAEAEYSKFRDEILGSSVIPK